MAQNLIPIWFDRTYESSDINTNRTIHLCLCKNFPYLMTFRDTEKCVYHLNRIKDDDSKVILIVSSKKEFLFPDILLHLSHELPQIDSVYILYLNDTIERIYVKDKIYTDIQLLSNCLSVLPGVERHRRKGFIRDDFNISAVSSTIISARSRNTISEFKLLSLPQSNNEMKRQEAEFMYAMFLRDILIKYKSTEVEMIKCCREKCAGVESDLNIIDEIEEWYDATNAVFLYTRDSFLYRLLNKALREQDVDVLIPLRLIIKDLQAQLQQLYIKRLQKTAAKPPINTVYRGQRMKSEEFNKKIRNNEDGFFSVNGFLSTTRRKDLAMFYVGELVHSSTEEAEPVEHILFEITIDENVNEFPYADISKHSAFGETEEEILFAMGAIFRIQSIVMDNNTGVWTVKIILTSEEDEELKILTESLRKDINSTHPIVSLSTLMLIMAKYTQAENCYRLLLQDPDFSKDFDIVTIVNCNIASIYKDIGRQVEATNWLETLVNLVLQHSPFNPDLFIHAYNSLGESYATQGSYKKALACYHKVLDTKLNEPNPDQATIAALYNSVGSVYEAQHRYSCAIDSYKEALRIRSKIYPSNHPDVAAIYSNIGAVYRGLGDYNRAVQYLEKTLDIQTHSLTSNHPDLATTYNNLSAVFSEKGDFEKALYMSQKSIDIYLTLSTKDPDIANSYNNTGGIYRLRGEQNKAIEYFRKALEIQLISLRPNHPLFAATYNNLATAYADQGKLEDALEMFAKSLDVSSKALPSNHPSIANTYNNIAAIYIMKCDYDKCIEHVTKALKIQEISLDPDHPSIAESYNHISQVYFAQGDNDKAIEYLHMSLSKQQKADVTFHPRLAKTYYYLAQALFRKGILDDSIENFERSLDIHRKILPADHKDISTLYNELAHIYYKQENYRRSSEYWNEVLETQLKSSPLNSLSLAKTYNNLGSAYWKQGIFHSALTMFKQSLRIELQSYPTNDTEIALIYRNISEVYSSLGHHQEVIEYLNKVVAIQMKLLPANNLFFATLYFSLGYANSEMDRFTEALEMYEKCLQIRLEMLESNHPDIADTYNNMADIYSRQEDYKKAVESCNKALEVRLNANQVNYRSLTIIYRCMAGVFYKQKQLDKALEYTKKAYNIYESEIGINDPGIIDYKLFIDMLEKKIKGTI